MHISNFNMPIIKQVLEIIQQVDYAFFINLKIHLFAYCHC